MRLPLYAVSLLPVSLCISALFLLFPWHATRLGQYTDRAGRMKVTSLLVAALVGAEGALAVSNPHRRAVKKVTVRSAAPSSPPTYGGNSSSSPYLTSKTKKFVVDGTKIPDVDFDIGESYAGTLPISANASDPNQLYFWFFPSKNTKASDEIVIWLNGGPGCSSMDGLLQENGPFLWQSGTYAPQPNPFSWTNLTNMIYVDQPIGTGFSPAAPGAPAQITNEIQVAQDFMGFWKNFMSTFDLQGRKVYITGESYAGQYIPYISHQMLLANDTKYFNVKGIQINDPSINEDSIMIEAPAVWHLNEYQNIFRLNDTALKSANAKAESCGYNAWLSNALTFPPKGPLPPAPQIGNNCDVWGDIVDAAVYLNPCFNIYHLTDYCPFPWDVMGFPSLGDGPNNYFNRSDVQKAINAPPTNYAICGDPTLGLDSSPPSGGPGGPLPAVIERTNNVIIGHGMLDYLLLANGSLATIQNMTWHGKQGFQKRPSADFFVPYNDQLAFVLDEINNQPIPATPVGLVAGGGFMGKTHTERGLTFVTVYNSGHEIPQYNPGAAYRQLEFLLGRIKSLTQQGKFTTQ